VLCASRFEGEKRFRYQYFSLSDQYKGGGKVVRAHEKGERGKGIRAQKDLKTIRPSDRRRSRKSRGEKGGAFQIRGPGPCGRNPENTGEKEEKPSQTMRLYLLI